MNALRVVLAALRLQLVTIPRSPMQVITLLTAPLFSVMFLSIVVRSGHDDQIVNAVIAPGLVGLWSASLQLAGAVLGEDRSNGRLELLLCARAPLSLVIFGRILTIILIGSLTFAESWAIAVFGFGVSIPVHHPVLFVAAVAATCLTTAGTATALAAGFVLSRNMRVFQNALNYPLYILGGVIVPLGLLPAWLGVPSRVVFLSWSSTLLRDSVSPGPPDAWALRLGMVLLLGAAALACGIKLISVVADRIRVTASASYA